MVYRGRPSKGCELCRARKIKCSQDRPACEQCIKHGVPCPGYRDLHNANFLDESQAIIRRARSSNKDGTSASSDALITLSQAPNLPLEDKAIEYFYGRFVISGFTMLLPDRQFYKRADPVLSNALMCTAMAALANFTKSPQTLLMARLKYAHALTVTNKALGNATKAREDTTIAAVLLLGMYENLDCDSIDRMTNWQNHIRGLSSLLKMRDPAHMSTKRGFELFVQIRPIILINALWDHTLVPEYWIDHLHYSDAHHSPRQKHVNALVWTCIDVANLRAKIRSRAISDPVEIYRQVSWLDSQLAKWESSSTSEGDWSYTEVYDETADPRCVWRGTYHVYHDFGAAGNWSILRAIRLVLLNMMGFRMQQIGLTYDMPEQVRLAEERSRIALDILSAAPLKLGLSEATSAAAMAEGNMPLMPAYHEQLSLFNLSQYIILAIEERRDLCDFQFVIKTDEPDLAVRWEKTIGAGREERYEQLAWILNRLEHIAELGVRQATVYASILRTKFDALLASRDPGELMHPWKYCRTAQERALFRQTPVSEEKGEISVDSTDVWTFL